MNSCHGSYFLFDYVVGPKRRGNHRQLLANRKSMLLSELCVVAVSISADLAQAQKGCGTVLKFRFSPYTQIEFLRVAILKVRACVRRKKKNGTEWPINLVLPSLASG